VSGEATFEHGAVEKHRAPRRQVVRRLVVVVSLIALVTAATVVVTGHTRSGPRNQSDDSVIAPAGDGSAAAQRRPTDWPVQSPFETSTSPATTSAARDSAAGSVGAASGTPTPTHSPPPPQPPALMAPVQSSPADGSVFNYYPRTTTLTWQPVPGAAQYLVETEFCGNSGANFQTCLNDENSTGWVGPTSRGLVTDTTFTFNFVGAQPGQWRVAAIDASGNQGPFSPWWNFVYLQ
jgi:hypothetical protein